MNTLRGIVCVWLALVCLPLPAQAADLGYRGWGPRFGLADDPDQVVGGVTFDLGEFAPDVRFQPDIELGLGDDHTILALTAPAHYVWRDLPRTSVMPYAGGGLTLGWIDRDHGKGKDDSDFDLAFQAIGGAEWRLKGRQSFFTELSLIFGDIHDVEIVAGWMFRR